METKKYPKEITALTQLFKKFPGIGSKTAQKLAFHLLQWDEASLHLFSDLLGNVKDKVKPCKECGALLSSSLCPFCDAKERRSDLLCIVSSPKDIYLIEETGIYQGLYHVLNHLLSPMHGFHAEELSLEKLEARIQKHEVKEVIIALDSTLEGDTTSLFIKNRLSKENLSISRLAFGLPLGSSLEYTDGGTLSRAFMGRVDFS